MRTKTYTPASRLRRFERGFSLIELLIVIAIILIIAAIAIPNFMHSKMAANEAAAAENVRTITTASVVYSTSLGKWLSPELGQFGWYRRYGNL